tara:strand:- start:172 stop:492 length:321 start_codon:yes stop_codon:yes gene_type:complete
MKLKTLTIFFVLFNFNLFSNDYLVIDVRTGQEYKTGHVEEAINIEWQDISQIVEDIKKDKKLYLYCRSGNRSQKATNILIDLGYEDVTNLGGVKDAAIFLDKKIIK